MCGKQGFIAVRETVHLVKFTGKGFSIFFSSGYVTLLSTTGYKVLKYSSRIHNCEFYEQFSCRKRMFPILSLGVECKVCLSHAGGLR